MDDEHWQSPSSSSSSSVNNAAMKPSQKSMASASAAVSAVNHIKGFPKQVPKALTEHKLKRLNILTYINDKKSILFTKKAFKHEKERIWRQIFSKMLEFGMVSKEKDWRYVRDVSFSNWRKRAQKRLKHLAANGYCLNMDECEFLIYDILGKTPDKSTTSMIAENLLQQQQQLQSQQQEQQQMQQQQQQQQQLFSENWMNVVNGNMMMMGDMDDVDDDDDDESDEYMIDSDEDDDDDVSFDEMLLVPKIVLSDNIGGGGVGAGEKMSDNEAEHEPSTTTSAGATTTATSTITSTVVSTPIATTCIRSLNSSSMKDSIMMAMLKNDTCDKPESLFSKPTSTVIKNGGCSVPINVVTLNGNVLTQQQSPQQLQQSQQQQQSHRHIIGTPKHFVTINGDKIVPQNHHKYAISLSDVSNFEAAELSNLDAATSTQPRYMNKFRELRLLDLEIENKVLKNRYMKLKIFQLEESLGVDHCKEVKEFDDCAGKQVKTNSLNSNGNGNNNNNNNPNNSEQPLPGTNCNEQQHNNNVFNNVNNNANNVINSNVTLSQQQKGQLAKVLRS